MMLPPPPPRVDNPVPAPTGVRPASARPPWRQGRVGWSIAHVAIGVGIWFVSLFILGIAVGISGRTEADVETLPPVVPLMTLVASVVGWFCFAYGEGSTGSDPPRTRPTLRNFGTSVHR